MQIWEMTKNISIFFNSILIQRICSKKNNPKGRCTASGLSAQRIRSGTKKKDLGANSKAKWCNQVSFTSSDLDHRSNKGQSWGGDTGAAHAWSQPSTFLVRGFITILKCWVASPQVPQKLSTRQWRIWMCVYSKRKCHHNGGCFLDFLLLKVLRKVDISGN